MSQILPHLSHAWLQAFAWSLIHALWQLSVLFMLYRLAMQWFTTNARVRHWIGIGTLLVQFCWTVGTCIYYYRITSVQLQAMPRVLSSPAEAMRAFPTPNVAASTDWLDIALGWGNLHLNYLVYAWLLGVVLLVVRLMGGYYYVQRLRWQHIQWVDDKSQQVFDSLLESMAIPYQVILRISSKIDVPMTIGFLQPIVLMPVGLLSGLSEQELKAILAHELAHIKRYDYLINLIQSFIEIVFFYHPLVWVISDAIRDDRENACDDWALEVCQNRIHLAKALTVVEHFKLQSPSLAMSFSGNKSKLLGRVQRVLGVKTNQTNSPAGIIAASICMVLTIGSLNFTTVKAQATQVANKLHKLVLTEENEPKTSLMDEKKGPSSEMVQEEKNNTQTEVSPQASIAQNQYEPVFLSVNEDSLKVLSHLEEIAKLEKQIHLHSDKIKSYSKQIKEYNKKIQTHSASYQNVGKIVQKHSAEIGKLAKQQAYISLQLEDEALTKADKKKLREDQKQIESQLRIIEEKIEKSTSELTDVEMQKMEVPMDSLSELIEVEAVPLQNLAREIEVHAKAIDAIDPDGKYYQKHKRGYSLKLSPPLVEGVPLPPSPPEPPTLKLSPVAPKPPKEPKAPKSPKAPKAPIDKED